MKKYDIAAIGELNVDIILNRIESEPEIGKEKFAKDMTVTLGSSTAIFAANAAALGSRVCFVGLVGRDPFGSLVKTSLEARGVDTRYVMEGDTPTGATICMSYGMDRANLTYQGAMDVMGFDDIDKAVFDVEDAVPGVKFKDITVELDYERIVKSEEELSAYRETARIQDELIDMFPAIMWAGRSLSDIVADMRRVILKTGAGINHLHFFGRGMTSIDFHGPEYRLKKGDFGAFMFEFSGPGNCALATMTPFVVGEPKPYDEAMYEACEKTNAYLCRIMKAGRSLADVGKEVQAYARSLGYDAPDQLTGHSTGYFYYERLSTEDDTIYLPLKENMLFGAPGFFADKNGNGLFGLSGLYGDPNTPFIWGTGGISVVGKEFSSPLMKSHEKLIQII